MTSIHEYLPHLRERIERLRRRAAEEREAGATNWAGQLRAQADALHGVLKELEVIDADLHH